MFLINETDTDCAHARSFSFLLLYCFIFHLLPHLLYALLSSFQARLDSFRAIEWMGYVPIHRMRI